MIKKKELDIFNQNLVRNLSDKIYEKRKIGALEVKQMVYNLRQQGQKEKLNEVFLYLKECFIKSSSNNMRKGGLIALAASSLGLEQEIHLYLHMVIPPILECFSDFDARVRYHACESLYNVTKFARGHILEFLDSIFDDLCKLMTDPDSSVRNAALLLDLLIKDIFIEGHRFDVAAFIEYIARRMFVNNVECRIFFVSWIVTLNSIPCIEMTQYIHLLLDGLFNMLNDSSDKISTLVSSCLHQFLEQLGDNFELLNTRDVLSIATLYCHTPENDKIELNCAALQWIYKVILLTGGECLSYVELVLDKILSCIPNESQQVVQISSKINSLLLKHTINSDSNLSFNNIFNIVFKHANCKTSEASKIAVLNWIWCLYEKQPIAFSEKLSHTSILNKLVQWLDDDSKSQVDLILKFFQKISVNSLCFQVVIDSFLKLFESDKNLLEIKGNSIINMLTSHLSPQRFYESVTARLIHYEDCNFKSLMVRKLNYILMTSSNLHEFKISLLNLSSDQVDLFLHLYKVWCYDPSSLLCLCLLAQLYEHSAALVDRFSTMEMTVEFFLEIDKLVQLLNSHAFSFLRLQLVYCRNAFLIKALYGLLMLIPQSKSYEKLKKRIKLVNTTVTDLMPCKKPDRLPLIASDELMCHFDQVQKKIKSFLLGSKPDYRHERACSDSSMIDDAC